MLDLPKRETFGIVFHTVRRELWRPWVQALRDGRGGRFTFCRAMAYRTVLPIQLDGGDEIFVVQRDRIGTLSLATQSCIQRRSCGPRLQPSGSGVRIPGNDAIPRDEIPAYQSDDDSRQDRRTRML